MYRIAIITILTLLVALALPGCDLFRDYATVKSDTTWSGSFNGRTVDGSNDQKIELGTGSGPKCAVVQKKTRAGFLTVRIDSTERTTTAEFGVVSVCGSSGVY